MKQTQAYFSALLYLFVAGMYFYHLGEWTYRLPGFFELGLSALSPSVKLGTVAYLTLIALMVIAAGLKLFCRLCSPYLILALLTPALFYESMRIADLLIQSHFTPIAPEVVQSYLTVRLSLIAAVLATVILTLVTTERR